VPSRDISVSTVAYDGYPLEDALREIAKIGIRLVEPAYIKGYMDFDEAHFEGAAIVMMRAQLAQHGLRTIAISAHMDSGNPDAVAMLARRIKFTAGIGARFTITNATTHDRRFQLEKTLAANLPLAESLGVTIALENPGNGPDNLMINGSCGAALVKSFNSPWLKLNYDTANALTCTEGETRPETDIDHALGEACHMHLKDVVQQDGRWRYVAVGKGEIDYDVLLSKLKNRADLPLTLELPLRLKRLFHKDPECDPVIPSLEEINSAVRSSWNRCAMAFTDITFI
jgi:sugar phosphate isomerase/epimerase